METEFLAGLVKTRQAGEHLLGPRKHIAHIVKKRKTGVIQKVRHGNVWKTHLQTVEEHSATPDGKSGEGVARSCLIDPNPAMGVASAAEKTLRERDKRMADWRRFRRIQYYRVSERVLNPDAGGSGEDESSSSAAISKKRMVGGILNAHRSEVGLGAKIAGGNAAFDGSVAAAGTLQIVIAPVAHVEKIGYSHSGWLREERNEVVSNLNAASLYPAIGKAVRHSCQFAATDLVSFQHL